MEFVHTFDRGVFREKYHRLRERLPLEFVGNGVFEYLQFVHGVDPRQPNGFLFGPLPSFLAVAGPTQGLQ